MRRNYSPFNGYRYLLNKSTGEIHDLNNEKTQCQIDEIKPENIYCYPTYNEAIIASALLSQRQCNGCYYCNPSKDEE